MLDYWSCAMRKRLVRLYFKGFFISLIFWLIWWFVPLPYPVGNFLNQNFMSPSLYRDFSTNYNDIINLSVWQLCYAVAASLIWPLVALLIPLIGIAAFVFQSIQDNALRAARVAKYAAHIDENVERIDRIKKIVVEHLGVEENRVT